MADPHDETGINSQVLEENARLTAELQQARALLERPIEVNVRGDRDVGALLVKIKDYLPQLTILATNVAYVASALQAQNKHLAEIATSLKQQKEEET